MSIVKFKHYPASKSFNNLMGDFSSQFPSLFRDDFATGFTQIPPVNILKNETGLRLEIVAPGFNKEAMRLLRDYSWPGNVRELENVIERLANNATGIGTVNAKDVSFDLRNNGWIDQDDEPREILLSKGLKCLNHSPVALRHLSKSEELELYLRALDDAGNDLSKAARLLGIKRTTLHMRIKRLQTQLGSRAV